MSRSDERQQALEILGAAIVKIIPEHRASGDAVEHATDTAEALVSKFKRHSKLLEVLREEKREHRLNWNIADALDDFDGIGIEEEP